jgi:acetyl esterase
MPQAPQLPERVQARVVRGLAALPDRALQRMLGGPVSVDGQELHPEVQLVLKLLAAAGEPELTELSVAEARERVARDARTFEGPKVGVDQVRDIQLAGADGTVPARLYVPVKAGSPSANGSSGGDPALVYFHGGGFVVGDLDTHDNVCRFLARSADVRVLSVEYRLAPEHRFPAAYDDAVSSFRDVLARAQEFGVDPARVGVAGDSAGGNLAAGVAQATAGQDARPAFQLLFYPWLDLSGKRRSHALFREGFYLTEADLDWYRSRYISGDGDDRDPRCSPLLADELQGTAPVYLTTAGFDPLRDEGEEYAAKLKAAGVPVALHRQAGLIHGFVNTISIGRGGREAVLQAAGALRVGLS